MGNINFSHNAGFSWYCLLLMFSGITLLVLSVLRNQTRMRRIARATIGLAFFGYGFYLTFLFSGGHYLMLYRAFLLPVLLIMDWIRGSGARRRVRSVPSESLNGSRSGQP